MLQQLAGDTQTRLSTYRTTLCIHLHPPWNLKNLVAIGSYKARSPLKSWKRNSLCDMIPRGINSQGEKTWSFTHDLATPYSSITHSSNLVDPLAWKLDITQSFPVKTHPLTDPMTLPLLFLDWGWSGSLMKLARSRLGDREGCTVNGLESKENGFLKIKRISLLLSTEWSRWYFMKEEWDNRAFHDLETVLIWARCFALNPMNMFDKTQCGSFSMVSGCCGEQWRKPKQKSQLTNFTTNCYII